MPASMALAIFFSWIMLINALKVPFYLYYHRTIFLIYLSRPLDLVIWLASSALALIILAASTQARSRSIWFSVALLWLGILVGARATATALINGSIDRNVQLIVKGQDSW